MRKESPKRKLPMLAIVLSIIIILSITMLALAKYTTSNDRDAGANVAKWSFKVNNSEDGASSFNLIAL